MTTHSIGVEADSPTQYSRVVILQPESQFALARIERRLSVVGEWATKEPDRLHIGRLDDGFPVKAQTNVCYRE